MLKWQHKYVPPFILCGVMILVFIVELILPGNLVALGIRPRRLAGLLGIPASPFLHGGWSHLASNIIPLLVMGCMVNALDSKQFIPRTVILIALSGALTWLISSPGIVIGASGLVFAYWSFLIVHGIRARTFLSVVFALATIFIYGAMLFGLFRYLPGVSWAAHISGALAGLILALWISKR